MAGHWLRKGADVEVMSTDESLQVILFPAKIVSGFTNRMDSFLVKYNFLVTLPGHKGHHEVLSSARLRAAPPKCEGDVRKFKRNKLVDAFRDGGWRKGIIIKELKNGAYEVYFRSVQRKFEFKGSDLRLHRELVNGRWLPPLDAADSEKELIRGAKRLFVTCPLGVIPEEEASTSRSGHSFVKGMLVEVRNDEDGLEGSWYSAYITDECGPGKFLVEYQTLKEDESGSKPLVEEVKVDHLRPSPPEYIVMHRYDNLTRVDVYYHDGWWEGNVVKVLPKRNYKVYFESTRDEMVVNHALLRPHLDFVDGKWVK